MKKTANSYFCWMFLTGPGIRYIPPSVWHSKFFWAALIAMIIASILFKNQLSNMANSNISDLFKSLFGQNSGTPKMSYSNDGRGGYVHYQSKEGNFNMYYEFGGGDVVASIYLPSPKDWVAKTNIPLERREEVLNFIGRQVVKDQTTNGRGSFKIEGDFLNIYA